MISRLHHDPLLYNWVKLLSNSKNVIAFWFIYVVYQLREPLNSLLESSVKETLLRGAGDEMNVRKKLLQ